MYNVMAAVTAKGCKSPKRAFNEAVAEFNDILPGVTPSKIRNNWLGIGDNHCRLEGKTTVESYIEAEAIMQRVDTTEDCFIEIQLATEPEATEEAETEEEGDADTG